MRIKLAFAAITLALLSLVACNPDGPTSPSPSPVDHSICDSPDWPEPVCDDDTIRQY